MTKRLSLMMIFTLVFMFLLSGLVIAQQQEVIDQIKSDIDLPQPKGVDDGSIVPRIMESVFLAAGGLSVLFIVIGGVRYVISEGNDQKIQQAKESVLYAIIGLVVSMVAFTVVRFILGTVL